MWGRILEIMFGLWLIISPFIFGHYPMNQILWMNDMVCGSIVVLLALLSFWHRLRHAHIAILAVALWLIGFAHLYGGYPAAPGYQNNVITGLILLLLAIIPNQAKQPPLAWRHYYQQQADALTSTPDEVRRDA